MTLPERRLPEVRHHAATGERRADPLNHDLAAAAGRRLSAVIRGQSAVDRSSENPSSNADERAMAGAASRAGQAILVLFRSVFRVGSRPGFRAP